MAITVDAVNLEQVERKLNGMKQKAPKVLKLAVNDTARKARSRLAKEAQKTYAVKVGGFNRAMKIKLATNGNPVAIIRSTGKKYLWENLLIGVELLAQKNISIQHSIGHKSEKAAVVQAQSN